MQDIPADPRPAAPDIVPLAFWTTYEPDRDNPGSLKAVEWVRYCRRGSINSTTEDKVSRVSRGGPLWDVLKRYYEAWREGQDAPPDGTPWAAWPGVTVEQADILRRFHLLTVEDLAAASDGVLVRVGLPGIRDLQRRAQAWLATKDTTAAAARIAEQEQRLEAQAREIAEMRATLDKHVKPPADDEPEPETVPARRGPGRPPKAA